MSSNPPKPRTRVTYGKSRRALHTATSTLCVQFSDDDEDEQSKPAVKSTMSAKSSSAGPSKIPSSTSNSSVASNSSSQSRTKRPPLAEKDRNIPKSTSIDSVVDSDVIVKKPSSRKTIRKHRPQVSLAKEEDAVTMMPAEAASVDVGETVRNATESESDQSISLIVQPSRRFRTNARSYGRRPGERSRNPVVISSDSESEDEVATSTTTQTKSKNSSPKRSRRSSSHFVCVEIEPMTSRQKMQARRRTAVRRATPDQTATSSLTEQLQGMNLKSSGKAAAYPSPVARLLEACEQSAPTTFDAALQSIEPQTQNSLVQKAGEASYSEVFRFETSFQDTAPAILKVIPLNDGSDSPQGSSPADVYREVAMTQELAHCGRNSQHSMPGFVTLHSATVVKGTYPERLIEAWDDFEPRGEIDPRDHSQEQLFCLLHLSDGGIDLENVSVRNWTESLSIFAQVVNILADAEAHCSFEHRDLHWGNVVIKRFESESRRAASAPEALTWDSLASPTASGLHVQLIDFTLSRMTKGEDVFSFDLSSEPVLFQADTSEDYQFEVYRLMRQHLRRLCSSGSAMTDEEEEQEEDWTRYTPGTNVMWLHYLLRKLLEDKAPSSPSQSKTSSSSSRKTTTSRQRSLKRSGSHHHRQSPSDVQGEEAHDVMEQLERRLAQEVNRLCTQPGDSASEGAVGVGRRASRVGDSHININSARDLRGWFQRRG